MPIESILESRAWESTAPTSGTLTVTAGSANIVGVGTVFLTDLAAGDIVVWNDGTGKAEMAQVSSVTNDLLFVAHNNAAVSVVGAAFNIFKVADQHSPYFRGDNTVPRQPIIQNATPRGALGVNRVAAFLQNISINEGILIKSVYIRSPYQYTLGDAQICLLFNHYDNTGAGGTAITTIGEAGFFHMTVENSEIDVNAYVYPTGVTTAQWQLGVQIVNSTANSGAALGLDDYETANVSQVNVPPALNAIFHPLIIGIRIVHASVALIA